MSLESGHFVPQTLILFPEVVVLLSERHVLLLELNYAVQCGIELCLELDNPTHQLGVGSFQLREASVFGVGEDLRIKILPPKKSSGFATTS